MAGKGASAGGDPTRLGTLETQIMDCLWAHGTLTVADLITELPGKPAYTTIATVLKNLGRKGLVTHRKDGHASLYEASMQKEEYAASLVAHVLEASGDREGVMLHFVNRMDDHDADLLLEFLREREGGDSTP